MKSKYPYYVVSVSDVSTYDCMTNMPGVSCRYNGGSVCILTFEDIGTKLIFEIAYGDKIIREIVG